MAMFRPSWTTCSHCRAWRATANVVLGCAYHIADGVVVDTMSSGFNRLGLTAESNPEKIERDLMNLVPCQWIDIGHLLIFHGRRVCRACLTAPHV